MQVSPCGVRMRVPARKQRGGGVLGGGPGTHSGGFAEAEGERAVPASVASVPVAATLWIALAPSANKCGARGSVAHPVLAAVACDTHKKLGRRLTRFERETEVGQKIYERRLAGVTGRRLGLRP